MNLLHIIVWLQVRLIELKQHVWLCTCLAQVFTFSQTFVQQIAFH